MRNYLIIIFLLFYSSIAFTQTSIQVNNVDYTYTGNKKQSIKEVEDEAINHAKIKALSRAGIKEHVKTYSSLYRRTENNDYEKSLTSTFFSEKQGAVTSYSIIEQSHSYTDEGLPVYYIKINANVIKYETDADYNFKAKINSVVWDSDIGYSGDWKTMEDFSPVYSYDNDNFQNVKNKKYGCAIRFNVTPTKDTYLTIFTLWDDSVSILFPHEEEKINADRDRTTIFKKNKEYKFGNQPEIWFDSEKKSTGYRLVIVMHKEERTFFETLNIDNMWKWFFEIPRELRYITIKDFTVYNKQ
jgi:hypothetical protein